MRIFRGSKLQHLPADPIRENARQIMASNIEKDSIGRTLTPQAKAEAIEFAVDSWKGNMGNGDAAQIGIRHVTPEIRRS